MSATSHNWPYISDPSVTLRRVREYFPQAVLNNFGGRCGVKGLAVRELVVAS